MSKNDDLFLMKNFTRKVTPILFAFAIMAGSLEIVTAAKTKSIRKKPAVVVIRADWCRDCQIVESTMMGLMKDYGKKLNFVVLNVTDEAAEAKSFRKRLRHKI